MTAMLEAGCHGADRDTGPVRPPAVAGQFYPADPAKLKLAIEEFIKSAVPIAVENPVALVAPHAGYVFSGQICADAFRQAGGSRFDTVVILGTNHTAPGFTRIAIQSKGGFRTPLGTAEIDSSVAAALLAADSNCTANAEPHAREHSVEVQIPFVQVLFPEARIVPIVIGAPDLGMCRRFGAALAGVIRGRKALIVASSDLSHYPAYETAEAVDRETLRAIASLDLRAIDGVIRTRERRTTIGLETCACGEAPILAAAAAARELGATAGVVLSYANSGDTLAGDMSRVVGYGAVAISAGPVKAEVLRTYARPAAPSTASALKSAEKRWLLDFARATIRRYLATETLPLPRGFPPRLAFRQGAFVTLRKRGELRGCIGHMAEDSPLSRTVGSMALEAALNDSRFSPVTLTELDEIEIEVSVLTPARPISNDKEIVLGRDGVILAKAGRSAVFLPQVAAEQHWNVDQLLEGLCRKAGLPGGAWKSGAQLLTFQADVFQEREF